MTESASKHGSPLEAPEEMQRLREAASESFDVVFECSNVMMFAVDHHFRIVKVNQRWIERMGFQHSEVSGRKPSEFGTEATRTYVYSVLTPQLDKFGFVRQKPVCLVKKDGQPLQSFLDFQICRTASYFAFGAWYDREHPMQLEFASRTMRILVQLSRLQHEFELFWPAFDGYTPAIDENGTAQLPPVPEPVPEPVNEAIAPAQSSLLSIDFDYHRVTINDRPVKLTAREWSILRVLVNNAGRVIGPRQLLQEAWGPEYSNEFDYVRAYIRRLRKKLELDPKNPRHILLERGIGYRLVLQA